MTTTQRTQTADEMIEERLRSLGIPADKHEFVRSSPEVRQAAETFAIEAAALDRARRSRRGITEYQQFAAQGAGMSLVAAMRTAAEQDGRRIVVKRDYANGHGPHEQDFTYQGAEAAKRHYETFAATIARLQAQGVVTADARIWIEVDGQQVEPDAL